MFGFSNQSPGKRMFSTKIGNTNRTTADMMNGNCHHQTRNFGGPFAPPPQCYQHSYCNKSQHFGMGGITLGDYGIYPVHGVYHNPYKTFCASPCNMNVSGTDYNNPGRNGYQKTNFQNYYKPMARTQACTEPMHGAATGAPFNGNGLINGIKNFVNNMIQPKYDFYTDHNRRYNPKYRNNYKHDQQYVPVQRYTDGCLASFVLDFRPQIPVPKVQTVQNSSQKSSKSPNKDFAFQNPKEIKPCTPNQQKSNVQNQPNDMKITVLSVSSAKSDPVPCKTATPEVIAIFTSDDFPELPKPKKSLSSCKPDPKSKSSYFRNAQGPTRLQSPVKSAKNSENVPRPKIGLQSLLKPRRVSECDSDDSFVVLPKPIPTSPIAKSVTPPSLPPTNRFHSGLLPFRQRQRQISECSDDSFVICFQDESGNGNSDIDFSDISDDSDSDEDEVDGDLCNVLSDDDIDDDDENYVNTTKLDTLTLKDNNHISNYGSPAFRETSQPDSGFDEQKDKKVRFDLKPKVHVMRSWDYAYRAARKGPWEQIARDRCRFKQRIENLGAIISPVLARNHREKIFNTRFCDTDNNNVKTTTDDCKNITLDQGCKSKIEQTHIKSIENQYPIEENQPICITT